MELSNTKIKYSTDGTLYTEITTKSCDVTWATSGSRDKWDRVGAFENKTFDNIQINLERGTVPAIDALGEGSEIWLKYDDGAVEYSTKFVVGQKINKKINNVNTTYIYFAPKLGAKLVKESKGGGSGGDVTKAYVDEHDAATLSSAKAYAVASATSVTSGQKVYVRESGTDKTINYGSGVDLGSGTIVLRATNAQIKVPDTPTADGDAASKKYVDGQISSQGTSTLADAKAYTNTYAVQKTGDKVFKVGVDSTGLYFEEE